MPGPAESAVGLTPVLAVAILRFGDLATHRALSSSPPPPAFTLRRERGADGVGLRPAHRSGRRHLREDPGPPRSSTPPSWRSGSACSSPAGGTTTARRPIPGCDVFPATSV